MKKLFGAIAAFLVLLAWQLISSLKLIDPFLLPPPLQVFNALLDVFIKQNIFPDLIATLYRLFIGFLFASLLGISLGLLMGSFKWIQIATESIVDFFRSVPAAAFIPLALIIFGFGHLSKIALVIFSSSLVIAISTMYGVKNASKIRSLAAQTMKMTKWETFWQVRFYESLPYIFSGLRIGLSIAIVIVIVSEMFTGTQMGLGYRIVDAQYGYRLKEMYALIILTGILGYLLNLAFRSIENRVVHWAGK